MAKLLNIGLYCKNGWMEPNNDIGHRLDDLQTAIDTAFDTIAPGVPVPHNAPALPLTVFVAPEYLFGKNFAACKRDNKIRAYGADEMDEAVERMKSMSNARTNFLLIGGSIFWFQDVSKKHFWNKKPRDIVYNSAFVCYGGHLLLRYDKMNDCGELSHEIPAEHTKQVFQRGLHHGFFECDGLQCGIETCVDHEMGELRKVRQDLDIHFIASNSVTVKAAHVAAADNRIVIQANAAQKDWGNVVAVHPFAWNSKAPGTSQGQVELCRYVLP